MQQIGDFEIRACLHRDWIMPNYLTAPGSRAVDELVLMRGKHRVDVVVLNDEFHAFEIKSEKDTLDRLPKQQACYGKFFDRISLVVSERHVEHAVKIVPQNWGLIAVSKDTEGTATFNEIWPARRNYSFDPASLAQLLWREEAIKILAAHGYPRGFRTKPRKVLWKAIAEKLRPEEVRNAVREALKARTDWREES